MNKKVCQNRLAHFLISFLATPVRITFASRSHSVRHNPVFEPSYFSRNYCSDVKPAG